MKYLSRELRGKNNIPQFKGKLKYSDICSFSVSILSASLDIAARPHSDVKQSPKCCSTGVKLHLLHLLCTSIIGQVSCVWFRIFFKNFIIYSFFISLRF